MDDLKDHYILIKDNSPQKPMAYLLMPTRHLTGIEDPRIFLPEFINMWAQAEERSKQYPGQSPQRTALAINSIDGRTQNQLHIHISCVREDVRAKLDGASIPAYPGSPAPLALGPNGNTYLAVTVTSLADRGNPFRVIESFPGVKGHMGIQSIAVVGTENPKRYYVLDTYAHGTNPGAAEELLDETCD